MYLKVSERELSCLREKLSEILTPGTGCMMVQGHPEYTSEWKYKTRVQGGMLTQLNSTP